MDRLFLAMMVSALLLLIGAADILVNRVGVLEPSAGVAKMAPAAVRPIQKALATRPNDPSP